MAGDKATRRRFLQITTGILAGTTLLSDLSGTTVAQQSSEQWTQFGYDNQNSGHAPENTGPEGDIRQRSRFQTAGSASSPTVAEGTIYIGSSLGGSLEDVGVYALNAEDGTEEWSFQTDDFVESPPAVVNETVYVGSSDNFVYALDAADGSEQWAFETGDRVFSSPTVVDGTVYVGSFDHSIYALDADDGTEQWSFQTAGRVGSSPAVVSDTVYVGSNNDRVYAVDAKDGTEQWSFETGEVVGSPAVVEDTTYVGSMGSDDNNVYALDAEDGTERWSFETGDGVTSSPAVAGGTVYTGSRGNTVYALHTEDGTEKWSFQTDGVVNSSPAVVDGTVYVGDTKGLVYALDAEDGIEQWSLGTGAASIQSSPVVLNGTVYIGSGNVYALSGESETTPTPKSTATPETVETTTVGDAGESRDDMPILPMILGGLGLGGIGAWWYRHQAGADTETGGKPSGSGSTGGTAGSGSTGSSSVGPTVGGGDSDSDSSPGHTTPATEGTLNISPEPDTGSSASERPKEHLVPHEIPRKPNVSVDYDALTDNEPIASGGNADVSKATLPTPGGTVTLAIKRPRPAGTLRRDAVEQMLDEAETWVKLDDHDHIVGVVDYGSEPLPWIAMEYMDGGHLGDRRGEMELSQAIWTSLAVTKGVRHAHRRGVAHLDLKPQNVLLRTVEDAWDVPKVADWGLSKHLLERSKTVEGMSMAYAAPEQFDEDYGPTDDITDIYQLGAVFYELFTGRPPFEGEPFKLIDMIKSDRPAPPSEIADVPEALDDVVLTALAKEKDDRYDDIVYLRDDLRDLFGEW